MKKSSSKCSCFHLKKPCKNRTRQTVQTFRDSGLNKKEKNKRGKNDECYKEKRVVVFHSYNNLLGLRC